MPGNEIPLVVKGQRPTLLETDKANELIKAINALQNISIVHGDRDQVIFTGDQVAISYGRVGGETTGLTVEVEIQTIHGTYTLGFENGLLMSFEE